MDESLRQYEQIDNYLKGKLEGEALEAFEKRLQKDRDFAGEVEIHRKVIDGIYAAQEEEVRELIMEADDEVENPELVQKTFWGLYSYAAVITLLLGIGIYFIFFYQSKPQRLYEEYFQPYPNQITEGTRGSVSAILTALPEPQKDTIIRAMHAYENIDFYTTVALLETVDLNIKSYPELLFYLSVGQLGAGKVKHAISNFRQLKKMPDQYFSKEIDWYLALAYLRSDQPEKAKPHLQSIIQNRLPQMQEAKSILHELGE
ncbi:MAG: hypothetical protein K9G67_03955 [Bacteroidales bacterium]|nr:hypothetical protein [Bacteroidales bacterium]MCF8343384.1 hypothetical protein [Bacteroidales bacterium]MCF8350470.1 hypothetical protein [Bacteroidales bacterium]MCF8375485.1 hypothetical protein [Bacteroidales bacterium]MCF8399884.1 hypothetical protein [Bacteroidales bacterium]